MYTRRLRRGENTASMIGCDCMIGCDPVEDELIVFSESTAEVKYPNGGLFRRSSPSWENCDIEFSEGMKAHAKSCPSGLQISNPRTGHERISDVSIIMSLTS